MSQLLGKCNSSSNSLKLQRARAPRIRASGRKPAASDRLRARLRLRVGGRESKDNTVRETFQRAREAMLRELFRKRGHTKRPSPKQSETQECERSSEELRAEIRESSSGDERNIQRWRGIRKDKWSLGGGLCGFWDNSNKFLAKTIGMFSRKRSFLMSLRLNWRR